jgi:hypothetical protein
MNVSKKGRTYRLGKCLSDDLRSFIIVDKCLHRKPWERGWCLRRGGDPAHNFLPVTFCLLFSFLNWIEKLVAGIQILECCEIALLTCWDILLGEHQMVCGVKWNEVNFRFNVTDIVNYVMMMHRLWWCWWSLIYNIDI